MLPLYPRPSGLIQHQGGWSMEGRTSQVLAKSHLICRVPRIKCAKANILSTAWKFLMWSDWNRSYCHGATRAGHLSPTCMLRLFHAMVVWSLSGPGSTIRQGQLVHCGIALSTSLLDFLLPVLLGSTFRTRMVPSRTGCPGLRHRTSSSWPTWYWSCWG